MPQSNKKVAKRTAKPRNKAAKSTTNPGNKVATSTKKPNKKVAKGSATPAKTLIAFGNLPVEESWKTWDMAYQANDGRRKLLSGLWIDFQKQTVNEQWLGFGSKPIKIKGLKMLTNGKR